MFTSILDKVNKKQYTAENEPWQCFNINFLTMHEKISLDVSSW